MARLVCAGYREPRQLLKNDVVSNKSRGLERLFQYLPASCSFEDVLLPRLARIRLPYRSLKDFSLPRKPGIRKSIQKPEFECIVLNSVVN